MVRGEIYLVDLNPTKGTKIKKTRPAVIISPNEMNSTINTVIIAPLTSTIRGYPFRVDCTFQKKKGQIAYFVKDNGWFIFSSSQNLAHRVADIDSNKVKLRTNREIVNHKNEQYHRVLTT